MGFFKNLLSTVVTGNTKYLDPRYGEEPVPSGNYRRPTMGADGTVHADNYLDAASFRDGMTVEGDVFKTLTKTGPRTWKQGVEEIRSDYDQRPGESRAECAKRRYEESRKR